jgi:nucleoside-diphosphate-sugar epimerase
LRISNVVACPIYIETNCWSLLINNLCYQTATKEYIEIFNKSDVKRDFIPIISFLDILNEILKGKYSKLNGVLNVGSGNTFSLTQIVQIISERYYLHYNKKLKIKFHFNKTKENEILYFKSNRIDFNDHYNFNYLTREIDLLLKFCQLNFKK